MAGGLIQLVSYSAQDIFLTGNPQITFFKNVYRRHTNFAVETVELKFNGEPIFGRTLNLKVSKNADLISKMYLRILINSVDPDGNNFAWTKRLGHAILKQIDLSIGGYKIDSQYGYWLDIWYELSRQGDHEIGYNKMIGNIPELTTYDSSIKPEYYIYVPLQFWFNKFIGLSIPLIALQYQDVNITLNLEKVENLIIRDKYFDINSVSLKDVSLLVNYVYLDTEERKRFAVSGHEYLIEQVQYNGLNNVLTDSSRYILDFSFPSKEIIWAIKNGNFNSNKTFIYYSHQDKWDFNQVAKNLIYSSLIFGDDYNENIIGEWTPICSHDFFKMNNLFINNNSDNTIYFNYSSLLYDGYNLMDKISSEVEIDKNMEVNFVQLKTSINIRDLSIPIEYAYDTRYNTDTDVIVNIFGNYGLLIDGSINPIEYGLLQLNGYDRFDKREGDYFNYIQPFQHHENTPKDGINAYSFSIYPEQHQPSGTINFSRIELAALFLTFKDPTYTNGLPDLHYFNRDNELMIFTISYNILRFMNGFSGISYTT